MPLIDQIIQEVDDKLFDRAEKEFEKLQYEKYLETKSESSGDPLECYDSDREPRHW